MKLIKDSDISEVELVATLFQFLVNIKIKQSEEALDAVHNYKTDHFCSQCEARLDDCYCYQDYDRDYDDADVQYEKWKDGRLNQEGKDD